jgi:hypothetical protein
MVIEMDKNWFESAEIGGSRIQQVSKFFNKDFNVSKDVLEAEWPSWTPDERVNFAAAFSVRADLTDNDQRVLEFLIEKGNPSIWRAIALSVARHRGRNLAVEFLLIRVTEDPPPLANYYQAIEMLSPPECVSTLVRALLRHSKELELHPSLRIWDDRFVYLDYLSCSATLFKVTGQKEYEANIKRMTEHPDETVRQMAHMVASSSGITFR